MSDCIILRHGGMKKHIWNRYNRNSTTTHTWNRYNVIENTTYYWNKYTVSRGVAFSQTLISNESVSDYRLNGGQVNNGLKYFYNVNSTSPSSLTTGFPSEYFSIDENGQLTSLDTSRYFGDYAYSKNFSFSNNVFYKEFVFAYDNLEKTRMDNDDVVYWYYSFTTNSGASHNKYAKIYCSRKIVYVYLYTLSTSKGEAAGTTSYVNNSTAYPSNGISGNYWYVANGSSTSYSKGTANGSVKSTNRSQYPDDGRSGNYWYVYSTSNTSYSQGSYIDQVESKDRNTYPDNNYSGSYWYVYQGESGGSGSLKRILAG